MLHLCVVIAMTLSQNTISIFFNNNPFIDIVKEHKSNVQGVNLPAL